MHAHLLGWSGPALDAAEAGHRFLLSTELEGGGYPRSVSREGHPLDSSLDLYDQAFVLYAMAWWTQASGDPEHTEAAYRTLDALKRRLGLPGGHRVCRGAYRRRGRPMRSRGASGRSVCENAAGLRTAVRGRVTLGDQARDWLAAKRGPGSIASRRGPHRPHETSETFLPLLARAAGRARKSSGLG